jgi:hypothetical protein
VRRTDGAAGRFSKSGLIRSIGGWSGKSLRKSADMLGQFRARANLAEIERSTKEQSRPQPQFD